MRRAPRNEVDEVRWITRAEGAELLSYDYDRELLDSVSETGTSLLR